jgi:hypothetical protein
MGSRCRRCSLPCFTIDVPVLDGALAPALWAFGVGVVFAADGTARPRAPPTR